MSSLQANKKSVEKLVQGLDDAFNSQDLDGVMSFFDEGSIYDEFDGVRHIGKEAIRKAFEPQFRGEFGRLIFHKEYLFIEATGPGTGKVMFRWLLTMEEDGRAGGWRGLDILRFENGKLKEKHTYAKSSSPLVEKLSDSERVRKAVDDGILLDI